MTRFEAKEQLVKLLKLSLLNISKDTWEKMVDSWIKKQA